MSDPVSDPVGEGGGGITGSPFVRAFGAVGIPYAAGAMNIVVISAALSSANSNLYLTTRMLFSLSRSGYAPEWLARAFLTLYGTAVAGMLFIWIVILVTFLRFRRALSADALARLPIRMPFHRPAAIAGIVSLAAIAATTFVVEGLEYSVIGFLPFLAVMSVVYALRRPL